MRFAHIKLFLHIVLVALAVMFFASCPQEPWPGRDAIIWEGDFSAEIIVTDNGDFALLRGYWGDGVDIVIPSHIRGIPVIGTEGKVFYGRGIRGSIYIPEGIERISFQAFAFNQITGLYFSDSFMEPRRFLSIQPYAFAGNRLVRVAIPPGVYVISDGLFANNMIRDVVIPDSIGQIGWNAFLNNMLEEIVIHDNMRVIGSGAFQGNNITRITIGEGVRLGWYHFDQGLLTSFDNGFDAFYRYRGSRAGTYTFDGSEWHAEFR